MERIFGAQSRQDGIVKVSDKSYILFYGYGEENGNGYNYRERFDHLPTVEELRSVIEEHVNTQTQKRILTCYEWNGDKMWLSSENQQNYTSAYIVKELPLTIKYADGKHGTIETEEELESFYSAMVKFIRGCVESAWSEKDGVDYDKLLEIIE